MAPPTAQLSVVQYFEQDETNRPMGLVHGVVRECWLIDARGQTIEVVESPVDDAPRAVSGRGAHPVVRPAAMGLLSRPDFRLAVAVIELVPILQVCAAASGTVRLA